MSIGMTPKGYAMPQTNEEWAYLAVKYEQALIKEKDANSELRSKINQLEQRLTKFNDDRTGAYAAGYEEGSTKK